ncbi:hypothetical protein C8Q79DRAFT_927754 [Trametes meyenii]|nr:hypothetical protein C8Q79DRAFT_927754 [Trametes meyenii]
MSSPATVVDNSRDTLKMLTRLLVWYENRKPPASTYINGTISQEVTLHEIPWVRSQFDGAIHCLLDFWCANHTDWEPQRLSTVTIEITVQAPAILIRVPGVVECPGLGQEIQLLEQALGYDNFLKLDIGELRIKKEEYNEVWAVVWDQNPEARAKQFALNPHAASTLALNDYPDVVEHCTGKAEGVSLNERILERWDLRGGAWHGLSIGESFPLDNNVRTVLMILKTDKTDEAKMLGDGEGELGLATEVTLPTKKRRRNGVPKADIPNMSKEEIRNRTRVEDGHEYPGRPAQRGLSVRTASEVFSEALKILCYEGSEQRVPDAPEVCPRCSQPTNFLLQLSFKRGYAGAYALVCLRKECKLAHYPTQVGPPDDLLERIEAQRDKDEAGALRSRVVARREQVARTRAAQQVREQLERDPHHQRRMLMGLQRLAGGSHEDGSTATDVHRIISLVLWFSATELPLVWAVVLKNGRFGLHIADHPWIVQACKPTNILVFENWLFDMGQWQAIPWITSKVDVPAGIDRIFLRVMGMSCVGFGEELQRFEGRNYMFTQPALRPSTELPIAGTAPPDTVWYAIWTKSNEGPKMWSTRRRRDGKLVGVNWSGGTSGLHNSLNGNVCYWKEDDGKWQGYEEGQEATAPTGSMVLLRLLDAVCLRGLGDVLNYLDVERAVRTIQAEA